MMLAYPVEQHSRDLRIDFLRGVVMWVLVTVHIEIFSLYNFFTWERIGLISGAEGFVIFSGFVLGQVHRRTSTYQQSTLRLLSRSVQLYRINVTVIVAVLLISMLPWTDLSVIMTFKNWYTGEVYNLFPHSSEPWFKVVHRILLLKVGPHQLQILGLYIALLAVTPVFLLLLREGKPLWLLSISWIVYFYQMVEPARLTGAQFEYAFPLMAWQILYVHSLVVGYYHQEIADNLVKNPRKIFLVICGAMAFGFFLLAQNSPNAAFPEWARLSWVPAERFNEWHNLYFSKNKLGILRLLNYFVAIVTGYWLLTKFWKIFDTALGWLFIPIGQASLYVFIMHLIFVVTVAYIPGIIDSQPTYQHSNLLVNTAVHTGVILGLWWMVKIKFLYRFVPR